MIQKYFRKCWDHFDLKIRVAVLSLLFVMVLTSFTYVQLNHVTVTVDGEQVGTFLTFEDEQSKLLNAANVNVAPEDEVTSLKKDRDIRVTVKKAFPVTVQMGKEKVSLKLTGGTVADAIKKSGLKADAEAKVAPARTTKVKAGMVIKVSVRTVKTVTEKETVSFETVTKKTDTLYEGEKRVTQKGENGEKTVTYTLIFEDGKQVDKVLSSTNVTKQPKNEIVSVGTKKKTVAVAAPKQQAAGSSAGKETANVAELSFSKVIDVVATAYSGELPSGQMTCLGKVPSWGTVAVDRSLIPLGTKMYITSADGSFVYGYCTAGDVGGAIKGARVDLWMPTERECNAFGRRSMKVYILN